MSHGHAYPHRPNPMAPPPPRPLIEDADIDAAVAAEGEAFDISRDDLLRILRRAEASARQRNSGGGS